MVTKHDKFLVSHGLLVLPLHLSSIYHNQLRHISKHRAIIPVVYSVVPLLIHLFLIVLLGHARKTAEVESQVPVNSYLNFRVYCFFQFLLVGQLKA